MNLGKAIRLCRIQKELKQSDLAEKIGISVSFLSLIERGKRDVSFSTTEKIARALDLPLTVLIFLASDKDEIRAISPELSQRISKKVLELIKKNAG